MTKLHALAASIAFLSIATFLSSTIIVEIIGTSEQIAKIKHLIVSPGLIVLIPCLAITGITGAVLGKRRKGRILEAKKRRMPFIAANGLLILVPCAIFLNLWAAAGAFDAKFYSLQLMEIVAGAVNLALLGMNMRDGLKLTGKLHRKKQ